MAIRCSTVTQQSKHVIPETLSDKWKESLGHYGNKRISSLLDTLGNLSTRNI